jgi:hypothetical protein
MGSLAHRQLGVITDGPHYRGLGRMGQLGENFDQLPVEILLCTGASARPGATRVTAEPSPRASRAVMLPL